MAKPAPNHNRVVQLRFGRPVVAFVCLAMFIASSCSSGPAKIEITDAVVPVPGAIDQLSVYLTITNTGDQDDVLLSADTDVAEMTMLHETEIEDNGRASMDHGSVVTIPAKSTVRFVSGGRHLMLMKPKALEPGDEVEFTLTFQESGTVKTTAKVIKISELDP